MISKLFSSISSYFTYQSANPDQILNFENLSYGDIIHLHPYIQFSKAYADLRDVNITLLSSELRCNENKNSVVEVLSWSPGAYYPNSMCDLTIIPALNGSIGHVSFLRRRDNSILLAQLDSSTPAVSQFVCSLFPDSMDKLMILLLS